jgi:hypothetical protein
MTKRTPTHVGDRGDVRRVNTPPRGVGLTEPPASRYAGFEGVTPPVNDVEMFRAIRELHNVMADADAGIHGRIDGLAVEVGNVKVSHEGMAGEFRGLKDTIIKDRDDERQERTKRADHNRRLAIIIVSGLFSTGGILVAVIAVLGGKC